MFGFPFLIMSVLTLVLGFIVYFREKSLLPLGIKSGGKMFMDVLPLLLISFILAGLIQVLIPKEIISRWIGKESGIKGVLIGCIAGAISPGAPYISFPIIASLYKSGAGLGATVGFITAWSLWQVYRIPLEISIIGFKVAGIRFLSTLIVPPLAGIIVYLIF